MKTPEQWLEELDLEKMRVYGPPSRDSFISIIQAIQKDAADSIIWVVQAELETIQKLAQGTLKKLGPKPHPKPDTAPAPPVTSS